MKKVVALLLSMVMIFAAAGVLAQDVAVIVMDEKVEFDRAPMVEEGTLYIPLRFVAERLGATIVWNGETKSIFISAGGNLSLLQIGNDKLFTDSENVVLEKAPVLAEDRTLVTKDVIEYILGVTVEWDSATDIVTITK